MEAWRGGFDTVSKLNLTMFLSRVVEIVNFKVNSACVRVPIFSYKIVITSLSKTLIDRSCSFAKLILNSKSLKPWIKN